MPKVKANGISIYYEQSGSGDPLILIPYTTADHACYAFQVTEYEKHFTCISLDLRGTGETDKPGAAYTTEILADDVAGLMQSLGISKAHVAGLSLGAAIGMWLASKHPHVVKTLSLHSGWHKTDPFARTIVENWQIMAKAFGNVQELVIRGVFPFCFTPELYATRPDYIESLAAFVRSRPPQSLSSFMQQSNCVLAHDVQSPLSKITAPTLISFGRQDILTSTRFADPLKSAIRNSELLVFEGCAHAPLYEKVEEFNAKTLHFLKQHALSKATQAAR